MARYVIKQGKIWDSLMKRWVINGSQSSIKVIQAMCQALNDDHYNSKKRSK